MKQAKVVSVTPKGDFAFNGKTFYKFFVSFDNGDSGEYNSVKADQDKFQVGAETEYELTSNQYGNKIKPVYSQGGGGSYSGGSRSSYSNKSDDRQELIVKQTALKAAVDFLKEKQAKSTDVLKVADSFVEWVLGSTKKEETNYNTHFSSREEKIETAQAIVNGQAEDDLPF